jgi:predicted nucleotidyltransferase
MVLATLARIHEPVSGRAVGRLLAGRASDRGVAYALAYLVDQGIVRRDDHPPVALYRLNRDHVAAAAAVALGDIWEVLLDRCRREISGWAIRPVWAALFGSGARGEGASSSDLDLALVVPDEVEADGEAWREQVDTLRRRIRSWTGNPASIITFSNSEFALSDEPVVVAIRSEGLSLYGEPPARVAA